MANDWQRRLPSATVEIEPHAVVAVDLPQPLREFRVETLCALGNLMGQVFEELDVFKNRYYDLNPCISSYLEKSKSLRGDIRSS